MQVRRDPSVKAVGVAPQDAWVRLGVRVGDGVRVRVSGAPQDVPLNFSRIASKCSSSSIEMSACMRNTCAHAHAHVHVHVHVRVCVHYVGYCLVVSVANVASRLQVVGLILEVRVVLAAAPPAAPGGGACRPPRGAVPPLSARDGAPGGHERRHRVGRRHLAQAGSQHSKQAWHVQ